MTKYIGFIAGILFGTAALVPVFALAQTPGNALLSVYVQVNNPSSYFNYYGTVANHVASDFSVLVAGQGVSQPTFFGSQTGTQLSLSTGAYSVAVTGEQYGYTPQYSQGCTGTVAAGQSALCIITMNPNYSNYYPYSIPYNYYNAPSLSCSPAHQTVGLNQNVSFTAQGGVGGTYNWQVPNRAYPNVGPVLTVSFTDSGSKLVTVTNGAQTATCEVTVSTNYYPTPVSTTYPYTTYPYTTYPNTTYPNTVYPNTIYPYGYGCNSCAAQPVITNSYYPRLPNTGIEPLTAVQLALALTLLAGVSLLAAPYVRKAFAVVIK